MFQIWPQTRVFLSTFSVGRKISATGPRCHIFLVNFLLGISRIGHICRPSMSTVTHPSTNRTWRRLTSLIETNALPVRSKQSKSCCIELLHSAALTDEYIPGGARYERLPVVRDISLWKYHLDSRISQQRRSSYWKRRHARCGTFSFATFRTVLKALCFPTVCASVKVR